jgi:hypothetical protein
LDEYSTLAERVAAGVGDVHGCLILSRDGMVLGAFPGGDDGVAKPAWLRFATLGESQRGFVEFGDQIWVFVNRGPYAAFAVAGASVRPALLMDRLEQALLVAEESRSRRDTLRLPEVKPAPSGKPRTSLHPPADEPDVELAPASAEEAETSEPAPDAEEQAAEEADAKASNAKASNAKEEGAKGSRGTDDDGPEVDRVLLAKEFSGLLQVDRDGDEASS